LRITDGGVFGVAVVGCLGGEEWTGGSTFSTFSTVLSTRSVLSILCSGVSLLGEKIDCISFGLFHSISLEVPSAETFFYNSCLRHYYSSRFALIPLIPVFGS
jgi:hypothetical protein